VFEDLPRKNFSPFCQSKGDFSVNADFTSGFLGNRMKSGGKDES